jgi:uncharacterized linocin/CFP29 family protein
MNHLLRALAPISDAGWELLDNEGRQRLTTTLAARKLVDMSGPHGWEHSATNLGRTTPIEPTPIEKVDVAQRRSLPQLELRARFGVSLNELRDSDRGAVAVDLQALDDAARQIARAENFIVFYGCEPADIVGIGPASANQPLPLGSGPSAYPHGVAKAVEVLLTSGISGPYGLALAPALYMEVAETTEQGGRSLFDHLRQVLGGPIVWAPGVQGGIVVSLRGGDFLFDLGQDLSIGYSHHDSEAVHLYFEESFSFRVATPEAAVSLTP